MTESEELIGAFDARANRRAERRAMFKAVLGATALGAGFAFASAAEAQTVEANFYYYAAFGTPIPATSINGVGTAVPAATAANASGTLYNAGARAVMFSDASVAQYASEIASEEFTHGTFLRGALGGAAVAQPALDVGITPTGAFSSAARAAGLIGATTATAPTFFDPYANDVNFLYGAFIFEDVGVTAYKGASSLLTNKTYLDAAAGILAAEAYHAAIVRTSLDQLGVATPTIRANTEAISNARDSLDGASDDDQGIAQLANPVGTVSNIAPTDPNGLAYGRTAANVLNIVYLSAAAVSMGGFFPAGVNGNIKTSNKNA